MIINEKKTKLMVCRRTMKMEETKEDDVTEYLKTRTHFDCPDWTGRFTTKRGLMTHRNRWCKAKTHFKCTECGQAFEKKRGLTTHVSRWCGVSEKSKQCKRDLQEAGGATKFIYDKSRKGQRMDILVKRPKLKLKEDKLPTLHLNGAGIKSVLHEKLVGSEVAYDGRMEIEFETRLESGYRALYQNKTLLCQKKMDPRRRLNFMKSLVLSKLLFNAASWFLTKRMLRSIGGLSKKVMHWIKDFGEEQAAELTKAIIFKLFECRWNLLGHCLRSDKDRKIFLMVEAQFEKKPDGNLWEVISLDLEDEITMAADRLLWRRNFKLHGDEIYNFYFVLPNVC